MHFWALYQFKSSAAFQTPFFITVNPSADGPISRNHIFLIILKGSDHIAGAYLDIFATTMMTSAVPVVGGGNSSTL